jgi:elongator complex protein 3
VSFALAATPEYCRLTRVIRDIPSTDIVVGNVLTNFREIAQKYLGTLGKKPSDIRSREIKNAGFDVSEITLKDTVYETSVSTEHFLQYIVPVKENGQLTEKLLGFLRLSLPKTPSFISELGNSALIREVHVYGPAVGIGKKADDNAQHLGLGKKLMKQAQQLAHQHGYADLAVISAIGTREYYRKNGFTDGQLYQHFALLE